MRRPWQIWGAFLTCLTLVAAAVGWLSVRAWQADRAEFEARELAALEENVRLALWRMDSQVAPFVARESVRPPSAFQPRSTTGPTPAPPGLNAPELNMLPAVDMLEPAARWAHVRLYFQLDQNCRLTSPQVWFSEFVNDSGSSSSSSSTDHEQAQLLDRLRGMIDVEAIQKVLPPLDSIVLEVRAEPPPPEPRRTGRSVVIDRDNRLRNVEEEQATQQVRAANEFNARYQMAVQNSSKVAGGGRDFLPEPAGETAEITPLTPLVQNGELLLLRRARIGLEEVVQGCWLDWPALAAELRQQIGDLLPGTDVILQAGDSADPSRTLASLPVTLLVPPLTPSPALQSSSVRMSLIIAWGAMLLAALAVAALLGGVLALSERRASFVSAVTHELRTPLTTFRMYSEMLADGLVSGPDQQAHYLRTLRVEADRLSHLVENVLAYARLERGGLGNRMTTTSATDLIALATTRSAERAAQGGVEFVVDARQVDTSTTVWADPSAVEQVVFNLVDNACKYAAQGDRRRIEISALTRGGRFLLRVRDHGPGITHARRKVLFEAFSKSADEAANTVPGVGLGLALSRRLARDMGGDLTFDPAVRDGAAFELSLRQAA